MGCGTRNYQILLSSDQPLSGCEMFRLLRKTKGLAESLLSEFGNSPSCYVNEESRDQAAYQVAHMTKNKPWAWINESIRG